MNDIFYDGSGRAIPMGTSVTSVEGYTEIDTPHNKRRYCRFEVDSDDEIILKFEDADMAHMIRRLAILGELVSLQVDYSYNKKAAPAQQELPPDRIEGITWTHFCPESNINPHLFTLGGYLRCAGCGTYPPKIEVGKTND